MNGLDNHARAILDAGWTRGRSNQPPKRTDRRVPWRSARLCHGDSRHDHQRVGGSHRCQGVDPGGAGGGKRRGGRSLVRVEEAPGSGLVVHRRSGTQSPSACARAGREQSPIPKDEPTEAVAETTAAQRGASRAPRPKETPVATTNHLQEETALLAEVNAALGAGQLRGALNLLDTYDRRFPNGILREESSATRVVALCQLEHGPRASALAKRFLSQHASSPLVPRVQRACSRPDPVKAQGRCALLLAAIAVSAGCRAGVA